MRPLAILGDGESLYIKRSKVSVRNIRTSVTVGVASSVAIDVIMRMRYKDNSWLIWRLATCGHGLHRSLVSVKSGECGD